MPEFLSIEGDFLGDMVWRIVFFGQPVGNAGTGILVFRKRRLNKGWFGKTAGEKMENDGQENQKKYCKKNAFLHVENMEEKEKTCNRFWELSGWRGCIWAVFATESKDKCKNRQRGHDKTKSVLIHVNDSVEYGMMWFKEQKMVEDKAGEGCGSKDAEKKFEDAHG